MTEDKHGERSSQQLWTSRAAKLMGISESVVLVLIGVALVLVMMTMEIVYTVAISLTSHTLNAEPFLVIGVIAGIRRMLVITATSTELEAHPDLFRSTLVELGLLAATVVALAVAIWILRYSAHKYPRAEHAEGD